MIWKQMWRNGYCLLQIPTLPHLAGEYTLSIFFGDGFVYQQDITVLEIPAEEPLPEEPVI